MGIIIEYKNTSVIKIHIPDMKQEKPYSCGAAALKSIFHYFCQDAFEEKKIRKELNLDSKGADPFQIIQFVKRYGLKYRQYRRMNLRMLKQCIDKGRPVMIMLQAWDDEKKYKYEKDYENGHWLVAIGYDKDNFYFEDPSLLGTRGYIRKEDLENRWHDYEFYSPKDKTKHKTENYGIAIWGNEINKKIIKTRKIL